MPEVRASGRAALELATTLLHRARLADAEPGLWEAADPHWWWRRPRASDAVDELFWLDAEGPVAGVLLTDWGRRWSCEPVVVPGSPVGLETVWAHAVEEIDRLELAAVETLVADDDVQLPALLQRSGFAPDEERCGLGWLELASRPPTAPLPAGFVFADRVATTRPHHMQRRNGDGVEARLRESSLYDPALDLSVETADGETAGYVLFWPDPVTGVGLLEPMRVEEPFQRRGLARALIAEGLDRLARRGIRRAKVGYSTDAARALYTGAGFRVSTTARVYSRKARRST